VVGNLQTAASQDVQHSPSLQSPVDFQPKSLCLDVRFLIKSRVRFEWEHMTSLLSGSIDFWEPKTVILA
jgi:hypothetical protein